MREGSGAGMESEGGPVFAEWEKTIVREDIGGSQQFKQHSTGSSGGTISGSCVLRQSATK